MQCMFANHARGQSAKQGYFFSLVPSRVSLGHSPYSVRLNLVLAHGIPPNFRVGVHIIII